MNDLILHHYAASPFSEKVRLVLGLKRLAWRSVTVPIMPPKPDVVALTGGYRRTPFLQIGADVYCDTALMCRLLDAQAPEPPLYPPASAGIAEIVSQWADTAFFWTAIPFTMQPAGAAHVMRGVTAEQMEAFRADRAAMTVGLKRPSLADAGAALAAYLDRLESMLADGRAFLLGAAPSIADVSVAQSVWFLHLAPPVAEAAMKPYPRTLAWYGRVAAFGHGTRSEFDSAGAIEVARAAAGHAPCRVDASLGIAAGAAVTVAATDYATDPVAGRLVGLTRDEVVIERDDPRAGTLHVHFPRIGYQLRQEKNA